MHYSGRAMSPGLKLERGTSRRLERKTLSWKALRWEIIEPMEYQWVYTDAVISYGWSHVWCEAEKQLATNRGRMQLTQRG